MIILLNVSIPQVKPLKIMKNRNFLKKKKNRKQVKIKALEKQNGHLQSGGRREVVARKQLLLTTHFSAEMFLLARNKL